MKGFQKRVQEEGGRAAAALPPSATGTVSIKLQFRCHRFQSLPKSSVPTVPVWKRGLTSAATSWKKTMNAQNRATEEDLPQCLIHLYCAVMQCSCPYNEHCPPPRINKWNHLVTFQKISNGVWGMLHQSPNHEAREMNNPEDETGVISDEINITFMSVCG